MLDVVYETEVQQHEEGLAHDALMTLSEAADTDSHYITVGVGGFSIIARVTECKID